MGLFGSKKEKTIEELEKRIEELEKSNKTLKWVAVGLGAAFLGALAWAIMG